MMLDVPDIRIVVAPDGPRHWSWEVQVFDADDHNDNRWLNATWFMGFWENYRGRKRSEEKAAATARRHAAEVCEALTRRVAENRRTEEGRRIEKVTCGGM